MDQIESLPTPKGEISEEEKVFSYEFMQIKESLYLEMRVQMEEELLGIFNREVYSNADREEKTQKNDILQGFQSDREDEDNESKSSSSDQFSKMFSPLSSTSKKTAGKKSAKKVDDQKDDVEIIEEQDLLFFAKQNLSEQVRLQTTKTSIYVPNNEENENTYFQSQLSQSQNKRWEKQSFFTCASLNQSQKTGEIFMKEYQIVKQETGKAQKLLIAINFLKYNQKQKQLEFHGGILQDVLYNADENKLLLNAVLSKGESHYYFIKNISDESRTKQLILKKVSIGEPSDYQFLETKPLLALKKQFIIQTVDQIKIDLPEDFAYNLEDIDYCFMQNATINENQQLLDETQFLKKQFILIRKVIKANKNDDRVILIYSLEDLSKPLITIENIDEPLIAFYTKKNDKQYAFTLFGDQNQYEVFYDKKNGLNQKMQENSQYIQKETFKENYLTDQSRFRKNSVQIEVQSIKINTNILSQFKDQKKVKSIDQTYFISNSGAIRLIHPIQSQTYKKSVSGADETSKETDYDKIVKILKEQIYKYNLTEQQSNMFILFFNNKVNYENNKSVYQQILKFLLTFHKQPEFISYKQLFCYKDLIVGVRTSLQIDCYSINQNQFYDSFDEKRRNLTKSKQNKTLLNKVLGNFDFKNQQKKKIYQNNYDYSQSSNFSNQYLESYYINKHKKNVFTTHQKGFVNNVEYIFNPSCLLIDVSQHKNERDSFKILKLYGQDVKDLKLIKYHTSKNVAIFFFLHRNFDSLNDNEIIEKKQNLSGVHFFVAIKLQDLKKLIFEKKFLIEQQKTTIFIPQNIDGKITIDQKVYSTDEILSYEEGCTYPNWISNQIEFEMVRDLGDIASDWFPFILYNNVCENRYETFLCMINVEKLNDYHKLDYQHQEKIKFADFLQTFKINYYQSETEKYQIQDIGKDVKDSYRLLNQSQVGRHSSLFCRSSDWSIGLFNNQKELISAKFQVGTNVVIGENQYYFVDIQEFLITINTSCNSFQNLDNKFIYEQTKMDSNISLQPIQFTHAIRSQGFRSKKKAVYATPFENERILPNIDDDGNIQSTLVLLNNVQTNLGILQIIQNLELLQSLCSEELFQNLKNKAGQYVYITAKQDNQFFDGIFSDGKEIKNMNYLLTTQFQQLQKSNSQKLPHEQKKIQELYADFEQQNWQEFVYTIFELNDQNLDEGQTLQGNLVTQNINQLSFQNQPNNQLFICQTTLNKDIILQKYFDKNESTFWLFYYQKLLLTTSLANFGELFSGNQQQLIKRYFQPRFVLNGQNVCNLDLQNQKNEQRLKQSLALDFVENEYFDFMENSITYQAGVTQFGTLQYDLQKIVQVFDFNHFYNLQYDFSNYESIIERTMNQGQQKLLTFIVDYILNNFKHRSFNVLIVQDFPYLVFKTKTNINTFFNISEIEEAEISNTLEISSKSEFKTPNLKLNNLELMLYDPKLPQFGLFEEEENYKVLQMNNFEGPFYSKDEICHFILQQEDENINEQQQSSNLIPIVYSFINFENIIRKVKIDKILNKQILEKDIIQGDAQSISQIDDLFIATMILQNQSNSEFMTSSTIEKIICFQYQRVQPIVKKLLIAYILGFAIPFWYLVFDINYLEKNDTEYQQFRNRIRLPIQIIACLTQVAFLVFEFANIHFNGLREYLSDVWNLIDTSQFILFFVHLILRYFADQDQLKAQGSLKLFDSILQIMICILVASRILQFIRYNDDYSYLVQMLSQVFVDVVPFLTVFLLYIILFSLITLIMGADFGDDDYSNLPGFIRVIISIFRTSIGDIQAYDYGAWKDKEEKKEETMLAEGESAQDNSDFLRAQPIAITIIWIVWYFNIFFMVIILANFLIAEVSVTFEDVKNLGNVFLNKEKAKFNQLIFQIQAFFGYKNEFSVMVFAQNKDFLKNVPQDQQFVSMIETIRKNTLSIIKSLQNDIQLMISNKSNKSDDQQTDFDIQEQIQEMKNEIQELKQNQNNVQKDIIQIGISQEKVVIKLLQNLDKQREEDRKILQKLVQQSNSQPLRAKEYSFDEKQDTSQYLKNLTVNLDSKNLGIKIDSKDRVKHDSFDLGAKIEQRYPAVKPDQKDYRKLTQSASNAKYYQRQRDSSIQ